jgi:hypothetical protein
MASRVWVVDGCYLLHFERPIFGAQHYLGWSVDVGRRVRLHLRGKGARLVRQALRSGIGVELVRVWSAAPREQERALKRQTPKRHCPRCRGHATPGDDELVRRLSAVVSLVAGDGLGCDQ